MTTLREFSMCGPCTTMGHVVADKPTYWLIAEGYHGDGRQRRVMKTSSAAKHGLVHAGPCRSCRDHAETQYPNGYED